MGGVDLSDMLIALYKTPFRSHRWYLTLFAHVLDMCCLNAWLLYKRDCKKLGLKKPLRLKFFKAEMANALISKGIMTNPILPSAENIIGSSRLPCSEDVKFDGSNHFPQMTTRGRCRYCTNGQSRVKCLKCKARLCLTQDKNCFYQFHIVS